MAKDAWLMSEFIGAHLLACVISVLCELFITSDSVQSINRYCNLSANGATQALAHVFERSHITSLPGIGCIR